MPWKAESLEISIWVEKVPNIYESSLRTADICPRSSPLRDVSRGGTTFFLAKRPSVAMGEEKRLPFAGDYDPASINLWL